MQRRVTRGLRFRLTAAYALFLALLMIIGSAFLRQYLSASQDQQARDILDHEFADLKAYLRIEPDNQLGFHKHWQVDEDDPEEAAIKARLERVFLWADTTGKVIDVSPTYDELGAEGATDIKGFFKANGPLFVERRDSKGVPYLFRRGIITADQVLCFHRHFSGEQPKNTPPVHLESTYSRPADHPDGLFDGLGARWPRPGACP